MSSNQRKTIILIEYNEELYAFGSFKKASEIFRWINCKSIYNLYGGSRDFTYKGARIRKLDIY